MDNTIGRLIIRVLLVSEPEVPMLLIGTTVYIVSVCVISVTSSNTHVIGPICIMQLLDNFLDSNITCQGVHLDECQFTALMEV